MVDKCPQIFTPKIFTKYLKLLLDISKGRSPSVICRAGLLTKKHSLFGRFNLYPQKVPNLSNSAIIWGIVVNGTETNNNRSSA